MDLFSWVGSGFALMSLGMMPLCAVGFMVVWWKSEADFRVVSCGADSGVQ